jgi:hypothetical protein
MPKPQEYLDVEIPDNFDEWDRGAKVNYLGNTMDNTQVANYLRELAGVEPRDVPQFKKHEMILIALAVKEVDDE